MGAQIKIKWVLDRLVSLIAIIVLLPIFLTVSILVFINLGSPILFTQERLGKNGKKFKILKYRSMLDSKDKYGNMLSDDERLNKFGKFLRATSLDELPELINVLKGDMSIVGPRPLLVEYYPLYSKEQFRRHEMPPGITGLAQVSGRNHLSWCERFKKDVYYVDHYSLLLDIKILFMTVYKVLKRDGVSQDDEHMTMEKFNGGN